MRSLQKRKQQKKGVTMRTMDKRLKVSFARQMLNKLNKLKGQMT